MGSQENHHAEKAASSFVMRSDDDKDPKRLFLEIPLESVAADESINGVVFMLGFFENAKAEAVALVKRRRLKMSQDKTRIIVPNGTIPLTVQ